MANKGCLEGTLTPEEIQDRAHQAMLDLRQRTRAHIEGFEEVAGGKLVGRNAQFVEKVSEISWRNGVKFIRELFGDEATEAALKKVLPESSN